MKKVERKKPTPAAKIKPRVKPIDKVADDELLDEQEVAEERDREFRHSAVPKVLSHAPPARYRDPPPKKEANTKIISNSYGQEADEDDAENHF